MIGIPIGPPEQRKPKSLEGLIPDVLHLPEEGAFW